MKYILGILACLMSSTLLAQNGYIITKSDSTITGFMRYQPNFLHGHLEIEVWETKRDKNPKKYPTANLKEYAIKKDTFKILTSYYPFREKDTYIPYIELRVVQRGKLNLYSTMKLASDTWSGYSLHGMQTYNSRIVTYFLENEAGDLLAIDHQNMIEDLGLFLDFKKYARLLTEKEFKYKYIPDLIKLYNTK